MMAKELLACMSVTVQALPDIEAIRRVYRLPEALADFEVAEYAFQRQRVKTGLSDLPHYLLRVSHVTCLTHSVQDGFALQHLHAPQADEASVLSGLFQVLNRFDGTLNVWQQEAVIHLLQSRAFAQSLVPMAAQTLAPKATWRDVHALSGAQGADGLREIAVAMPGILPKQIAVPDSEDLWSLYLAQKYTQCTRQLGQQAMLIHYLALRQALREGLLDAEQYQQRQSELADFWQAL